MLSCSLKRQRRPLAVQGISSIEFYFLALGDSASILDVHDLEVEFMMSFTKSGLLMLTRIVLTQTKEPKE